MTHLVSLIMVTVGICLCATGCGQKGPLVLPQPATPEAGVESTPPAATNHEQ